MLEIAFWPRRQTTVAGILGYNRPKEMVVPGGLPDAETTD
jgi:hypothetical protein